MQKKSVALILFACILTLALLGGVSPISNAWWGMSVISDNHAVGLVGIVEAAKWGAIAGFCGAGIMGSVLVGAGVGL